MNERRPRTTAVRYPTSSAVRATSRPVPRSRGAGFPSPGRRTVRAAREIDHPPVMGSRSSPTNRVDGADGSVRGGGVRCFTRSSRLFASVIALCTTAAAVLAGDDATPRDLSGWGRVLDPSRDCDVSLDVEHDRLKITVPGTPHVLSAEDPKLPMNAPRVVRRVRGDFTAERPGARSARAGAVEDHVLRPLPRRRPDRLAGPVELPPARTGRRVHQGAASPLPQLRAARGRSPGRVARDHDRRPFPLPQAPAARPGVLGLVQPRRTPMGPA